jgi:hypothetical protein
MTAARSIFHPGDMTEAAQVMATLDEIQRDLALRQNLLEQAARDWYLAKREKEHKRAVTFLSTEGSVAERKLAEAEYEALRGVVRVMETRANIGMAILKAHGRA